MNLTDREQRMTELDPHWRERFADLETAELFYAKNDPPPRKPGRVIYSSRYEPPEYAPYREPDDPDGDDSRDDEH
jgi:hypothetical protein